VEPLRFVVYSDYLCPWCYNAALRLWRLEAETDGDVSLEWRSYLLRPRPDPDRDLERFRAYTRSWRRPAAEPDAGRFREWQGDAGPPSHSVPPQLAAKAAARLGPDAFRRLQQRLLEAYFGESRDISDAATLRALWGEVGLPAAEFERTRDPALRRETLAQHQEALESGVTGVPALRLVGNEALIVGAQPYALYRRWYDRTRARMAEARSA
jgi:predicted DsbA family dithiol-disulfide isomerase